MCRIEWKHRHVKVVVLLCVGNENGMSRVIIVYNFIVSIKSTQML